MSYQSSDPLLCVPGVRQVFRERLAPAAAHDDAHRREEARVQRVRLRVRAQREPQPAHAHAQRLAAVRLRVLRGRLHPAELSEDPPTHAHRRDALPMSHLRQELPLQGPPQPPPQVPPLGLSRCVT